MNKASTIDKAEVEKFSRIADEWWDEGGKFKPLHQMNPVRLGYIREQIVGADNTSLTPFKGLRVLDIGCGGGLLSIPMARLGAEVVGVDASERNIEVAKIAAQKQNVSVDFRASSAENLASSGEKFDIILNMEVVEHVADVPAFLGACAAMLKTKGTMFIATINRTPKSYIFAIVGAEYVLRLLPRGTHDWKKFLRPSEINNLLVPQGLRLTNEVGVNFNPFSEKFNLTSDLSVNYIMKYER
jgi:2-polyprenyl-6-hydroxyphenyl methylase/3-demethylubiquinone-9 3-methyltransferase